MKHLFALFAVACFCLPLALQADAAAPASPREVINFNAGWSFHKGDPADLGDIVSYAKLKDTLLHRSQAFASPPGTPNPSSASSAPGAPSFPRVDVALASFDDSSWRKLDLPHDWGIEGPFKLEYPGHTGKLPWWGVAWYRKTFELSASPAGPQGASARHYLEIDGAMSYASVWCNGQLAGGWPYGYSSFRVDLTPFLRAGERNTVAIRLDNPPDSSRWYPGGGIYRNVRLVRTAPVHVGQWGTRVTTPEIALDRATVRIEATVENHDAAPASLSLRTRLYRLDAEGARREPVASSSPAPLSVGAHASATLSQEIPLAHPRLWSLGSPQRYLAVTQILSEDVVIDEYETPFGIRRIEFTPDRGFRLNGERIPLNGVSQHHDLGALGAAFNTRAAERQLEILKEMGVTAVRTTHNPAAPELLDLCDRMGLLVIGESFDCWHWGKTPNDYGLLFNDWHERDLRAMIRRDRNHPSLILWSLGNEIVNVEHPENAEIAKRLVAICHEEDPARGATAGVNNTPVGFNGYQRIFDVFGFNYRSMFYKKFRESSPDIPVYGSETASTVSSRGEYFFPVTEPKSGGMSRFQMSSYDLYAPRWAWTPDAEFKWLDETPSTLGEFVWTGFDYLGEPTPYTEDGSALMNLSDPEQIARMKEELETMSKNKAPSRSSYFGIVDLAGFKKDRFFIYQARWRPDLPMAHILPHWTWPERVGEITPVHVYTSGDEAELFLNGQSLGRKKRGQFEYRLRWNEVVYAPGKLKVVAYKNGAPWAEDVVRTAGAPASITLEIDRSLLRADGLDLGFVTASLVDANGVLAPRSDSSVTFTVEGPADVIATDNGDATSHVSFQSPTRPAYNGLVLGIVRPRADRAGAIRVRATAPGLAPAELNFESVPAPAAR
jgi:beta-galactosidase